MNRESVWVCDACLRKLGDIETYTDAALGNVVCDLCKTRYLDKSLNHLCRPRRDITRAVASELETSQVEIQKYAHWLWDISRDDSAELFYIFSRLKALREKLIL